MPNYFFKAVLDAHVTGASLIAIERGPGIRHEGLDPKKRNSSGGATVVAAAQTGRKFNSSDSTAFGQCLTGNIDYAISYAKTDQHCLLRINLPNDMLRVLVRSAASYDDYASMQAAINDKECTAIDKIPPKYIEFLTKSNNWSPIANFPVGGPKRFVDDSSGSDSD